MKTQSCAECRGKGFEYCDFCDGTGKSCTGQDCYKCNGTGKIECDFCEGEGYVEEAY